jgi:flagellar motility protein MotE (MotC chaperone)
MKQGWTFFIGGFFVVFAFAMIWQNTRAQSTNDPRVVTSKDNTIGALRSEVPGSREMEAALKVREQELAEKEQNLKLYEERLMAEDERIRYHIEELEKLQNELAKFRDQQKHYSEENFKKLVKTYEAMTPKKAAEIISVTEDDLAVSLLIQMKEKKVAALLNVMEPGRAMTLSSLMANRKSVGGASEEGKIRP